MPLITYLFAAQLPSLGFQTPVLSCAQCCHMKSSLCGKRFKTHHFPSCPRDEVHPLRANPKYSVNEVTRRWLMRHRHFSANSRGDQPLSKAVELGPFTVTELRRHSFPCILRTCAVVENHFRKYWLIYSP